MLNFLFYLFNIKGYLFSFFHLYHLKTIWLIVSHIWSFEENIYIYPKTKISIPCSRVCHVLSTASEKWWQTVWDQNAHTSCYKMRLHWWLLRFLSIEAAEISHEREAEEHLKRCTERISQPWIQKIFLSTEQFSMISSNIFFL